MEILKCSQDLRIHLFQDSCFTGKEKKQQQARKKNNNTHWETPSPEPQSQVGTAMKSKFGESVSFLRSVHALVITSFSPASLNDIAALSNSSLKSSGSCGWIFCCCPAAQSCPVLCDPMDCSTPGFPVLHCLPEFAQRHVHWVSDAIQPAHPLPQVRLVEGFERGKLKGGWMLSILHLVGYLHSSYPWAVFFLCKW